MPQHIRPLGRNRSGHQKGIPCQSDPRDRTNTRNRPVRQRLVAAKLAQEFVAYGVLHIEN
jgi:hypothetical protein